MIESDGIDDVTMLVNSSPSKLMGANFSYTNGFSPVSSAVLCAKASMLLQVRRLQTLTTSLLLCYLSIGVSKSSLIPGFPLFSRMFHQLYF